MEYSYVKINNIFEKLKKAESEKKCIFVHAPVGTGKTVAVRYFYRDSKCLWLSCFGGMLDKKPDIIQIKEKVIVIDDISWINDISSVEYIEQLISRKEKHIVLIGRSRLPSWLTRAYAEGNMLQADESDMLMEKAQIEIFLEQHEIECTSEELEKITNDSQGYVLEINMMVPHLKQEGWITNIEITDQNINSFNRTAHKYGVN